MPSYYVFIPINDYNILIPRQVFVGLMLAEVPNWTAIQFTITVYHVLRSNTKCANVSSVKRLDKNNDQSMGLSNAIVRENSKLQCST